MSIRNTAVTLLAIAAMTAGANAQDFQIVKVASVAGSAVDQLKPKTIFFDDHRPDVTVEVHRGGQPLYPYLFGVE